MPPPAAGARKFGKFHIDVSAFVEIRSSLSNVADRGHWALLLDSSFLAAQMSGGPRAMVQKM
jgi:hypothetical protein